MKTKNTFKGLLTAGVLIACVNLWGLTVDVQRFSDDGPIPAGYQNVGDGIDPAETIYLSQEPFVDYLVPNNSGTAGITAQKDGGEYIAISTVGEFTGGANNGSNPDKYHVVFEWEDGTPLPFGVDYFGVSWSGWTASEVATLTTRIDLPSPDEVTVFHWFNDGWDYGVDGSGHDILDGHVLVITHYTEQGAEVDTFTTELSSGGAELIFGDHRQFYSTIITATRTAPGDYLLIQNNGGNVGYKGTAVALLGGGGPTGLLVGEWNNTLIGEVYGYSPDWGYSPFMGEVWITDSSWVYQSETGWSHVTSVAGGFNGGTAYWLYNSDLGWLYTVDTFDGQYWDFGAGEYRNFLR
jgi:hypothetical protein